MYYVLTELYKGHISPCRDVHEAANVSFSTAGSVPDGATGAHATPPLGMPPMEFKAYNHEF